MIVIVMGVSGSGKSYLAARLAEVTGWPFAEGDDFHSAANKAKMHAGIPLTDADRAPWLEALHARLLSWQQQGQSGVLSCSALKAAYRQQLAVNLPDARFLWLDPPRDVLEQRLHNRPGHYMAPSLLDSQLAILEPPTGGDETLRVTGTDPIEKTLETVLAWLEEA